MWMNFTGCPRANVKLDTGSATLIPSPALGSKFPDSGKNIRNPELLVKLTIQAFQQTKTKKISHNTKISIMDKRKCLEQLN